MLKYFVHVSHVFNTDYILFFYIIFCLLSLSQASKTLQNPNTITPNGEFSSISCSLKCESFG